MSSRERNEINAGLTPIDSDDFGFDEARALLWRAGFGGAPAQIRTLADWGPQRSVEFLLAVDEIPYERDELDDLDSAIMLPPSPEEQARYREALRTQNEEVVQEFRARRQRAQGRDRSQVRSMQRSWLARMIESPRPLEERMTLFWHGHFATSYRTIENSFHMAMQIEMFRRHALGNFGRLLFLIIRDPAMIAYLDNDQSRRGRPNENLARELMELFSLGVGVYSEEDIKEGARALTGYTFEGNEPVFREPWHDNGEKSILGKRGRLDGDGFVRAILEKKACSEFICAKLYRYFVADLPPDLSDAPREQRKFVQQLASNLRRNKYELKPMLRKLFLSEHFYQMVERDRQIKSPVQLVVGSVRSLETPARNLGVLTDAMDRMGQNILFPPSVKGWDGGRSWINTSTLYVRQNVTTYLLTGKTPSGFDSRASLEKYDPMSLLDGLEMMSPDAARDPETVCLFLLRAVLGPYPGDGDWNDSERYATLRDFVRANGGAINRDMLVGVLTVIGSMPEYQLC